jgi:hypothetical protein
MFFLVSLLFVAFEKYFKSMKYEIKIEKIIEKEMKMIQI